MGLRPGGLVEPTPRRVTGADQTKSWPQTDKKEVTDMRREAKTRPSWYRCKGKAKKPSFFTRWILHSLQSLCSRPQLNTIRHLTPVRSIRPTGQARRAAMLSIHFCGIGGLFTPLNVYPVKSTGLKWTISLGLALLNQEFILSGRSIFSA